MTYSFRYTCMLIISPVWCGLLRYSLFHLSRSIGSLIIRLRKLMRITLYISSLNLISKYMFRLSCKSFCIFRSHLFQQLLITSSIQAEEAARFEGIRMIGLRMILHWKAFDLLLPELACGETGLLSVRIGSVPYDWLYYLPQGHSGCLTNHMLVSVLCTSSMDPWPCSLNQPACFQYWWNDWIFSLRLFCTIGGLICIKGMISQQLWQVLIQIKWLNDQGIPPRNCYTLTAVTLHLALSTSRWSRHMQHCSTVLYLWNN